MEMQGLLQRFVSGKISIDELSEFVDERLFELRQTPDAITEEQSILSEIELLICEINDGFRSADELTGFIMNLLTPSSDIVIYWDGLNSSSTVISGDSNSTAKMLTIAPSQFMPAEDYYLKAAFV